MVDKIYELDYCEKDANNNYLSYLKSNLNNIYNFWISAFDGYDGVSYKIVESSSSTTGFDELYIYLNKNKDFYLRFLLKIDIYTGVEKGNFYTELYKNEILMNTFQNNTANTTKHLFYKSKYGLLTTLPGFSPLSTNMIYDQMLLYMTVIFVPDDVPTLIWNIGNSFSDNNRTIYVLSENHEEIEEMDETTSIMCKSCGDQKMSMMSAYSFVTPISCPHLYRVIGIPNTNYQRGKIRVAGKNLIWIGRYALEIEDS